MINRFIVITALFGLVLSFVLTLGHALSIIERRRHGIGDHHAVTTTETDQAGAALTGWIVGNFELSYQAPVKNDPAKLWIYDQTLNPSSQLVGAFTASGPPLLQDAVSCTFEFQDPNLWGGLLIDQAFHFDSGHTSDWLKHQLLDWFKDFIYEVKEYDPPSAPYAGGTLWRGTTKILDIAIDGNLMATITQYDPDNELWQYQLPPFGGPALRKADLGKCGVAYTAYWSALAFVVMAALNARGKGALAGGIAATLGLISTWWNLQQLGCM